MLPEFPINEKYWRSMEPSKLKEFALEVYSYYKDLGFPYPKTTKEDLLLAIAKCKTYLDANSIIVGNIVRQTMHLLNESWSYFPHSFNVQCNNMKSPLQAYLDDDLFLKIVEKRLKIGTYISDSGMRKILKTYSGVQGVSNFRPTSAYAIYDRYGGGVVWDMSFGYGGRLLGAYMSEKVTKYIGTDPSTESFDSINKLKSDLGFENSEIILSGSEDYVPEKESLDICFTSPPYFNTEKYSSEDSQSYIKYNSKDLWLSGFLTKTLDNCIYGLKSGGIVAINIASVKSYPSLDTDTFDLLNNNKALEYVETLQYSLSSLAGKGGFKYEPIFVFKKR